MSGRPYRVSYRDFQGFRHSAEVIAESMYEAGAVALSGLSPEERQEGIGVSTRLEIQIIEPRDTETLLVGQIHRWLEHPTPNANESAAKLKLRKLLAS